MKNVIKIVLITTLAVAAMNARAYQWVSDVNITKLGTYQHSLFHYVWLSSGEVSECQEATPSNPTLLFSEESTAGKSLLSVLMAAVVSKATVDVKVNGCDIVEVHLK
ncbi:MAG: hypothetical protein PVI97_19510 [Candidatus Thiodiazotropha sp.]